MTYLEHQADQSITMTVPFPPLGLRPVPTPRDEGADGRRDDVSAGEAPTGGPASAAMRSVTLGLALRHRRLRGGTSEAEDLLIADAEQQLERRVRAHLPAGAVRVVLTDNRYTMISVRRPAPAARATPRYELRLHHMFVEADPVIVRALARYAVDNDRQASKVLGDFIDGNQLGSGRARKDLHVTAGEVHDLRAIFDDLNARYFGGRIAAAITWGPRLGPSRRRNSIKMGSYIVEDRLIRMHRCLDRAWVPRFFVEWIVFHEMLHQVHDIKLKGSRREFHSPAFLADERKFEHYAEARAWERTHLEELLCA